MTDEIIAILDYDDGPMGGVTPKTESYNPGKL